MKNLLVKDVYKIENILKSHYDCEVEDVVRSKKFNLAFTLLLKHLFSTEEGYEIISSKGTYCYASGYIKNKDGKTIYYLTPDYRFWNWENILYRKDSNDRNNYSTVYELKKNIEHYFDFIK